jgi:hypothetical protein
VRRDGSEGVALFLRIIGGNSMAKGLLAAGKEVIKLFNDVADGTSTYDYLVSKMTKGVVLKKVVHPGFCPAGQVDLLKYLNGYMKPLNPRLDGSEGTLKPHPSNNPNGTYGLVTGSGYYYDGDTTTAVSFTLAFVRKTTDDDWMLDSGYANPD